jgi:hypothetical protein
MGKLWESLGVWLFGAISGIVGRVLASLGMSVLAYVGVVELGDQIVALIAGKFGAASDVLAIASMAGIDIFVSLVISAHIGLLAWVMAATGFKRLSFVTGGQGAE